MPGFIIHDITTGTTPPPPPSSDLPNSPPATVQKLRKASTKVIKHIKNDHTISPKVRESLSQILAGGLALAEVGAQFAEDNVRILQRKKRSDTSKSRRPGKDIGPCLVRNSKKRIADRGDQERLQAFNRSKKAWQQEARLRAIADGNIVGDGEIEPDNEELGAEEWVDDIFCIDLVGGAV
jgi:hypothetical protein